MMSLWNIVAPKPSQAVSLNLLFKLEIVNRKQKYKIEAQSVFINEVFSFLNVF